MVKKYYYTITKKLFLAMISSQILLKKTWKKTMIVTQDFEKK